MDLLKIFALTGLVCFHYSSNAYAGEICSEPEKVNMAKAADLAIPNSPYSVGICYLPEVKKNGVLADHHDLILLKENNRQIAKQQTTMSITVGRIADLVLEKTSNRFISVAYGAGEFCNGLVIFDVQRKKVAAKQGCLSYSDQCHVTQLMGRECKAIVECKDEGAEGEPPRRKKIIRKTLDLCVAG